MVKIDRRIHKSQEAIKQAVIELMTTQKFDQITIQDISDKADVSRRTVYLHYADKFDLLDKLITERIDEMRQLCDYFEGDADYRDMGLLWFQYFESHSLFFSAILTNQGSSFFRSRFLDFFLQELKKTETDHLTVNNQKAAEHNEVDIQFLGAAIVGIVEWWFEHEMPYPPSYMAQRIGSLLERNLEVE